MKHLNTMLALGLASAGFALPNTAFAQAWSHISLQSASAEAARGNGTANAGVTVSGEGQQGAGPLAGGGRSTQRNSMWAKIKSNTYTIASLRSIANAHSDWGSSHTTSTSVTATLFGQTVLNEAASCGQSCESLRSKQVTKDITAPIVIWGWELWPFKASISAKLRGSTGYNFAARATSKPLGGFADMASSASNGANGTVWIVITAAAGFSFFTPGVGQQIEVMKASVDAAVSDRMRVSSRTDLDLGWRNMAKLTLGAGGGSIVVEVCGLSACPRGTLVEWTGFSKTWTLYDDMGALSNESF